MSIPANCKTCGYSWVPNLFHVTGNAQIKMQSGTINCPRCGARADLRSGTYDFVNGILAAFTAPGVTRANIEAVKSVVERAVSDEITAEMAVEEVGAINSAFANMLAMANEYGVALQTILGLLVAIIALAQYLAPDETIGSLLEEAQRQNELTEQLVEELERQNDDAPVSSPKRETTQPDQAETIAKRIRDIEALSRRGQDSPDGSA